MLHWLGITEEHHLLDDVHLVVDINGFVNSPIIYKTVLIHLFATVDKLQ